MSRSVLQKLLAGRALRTGYGTEDMRVKAIESRRKERVFGADRPGRSWLETAGRRHQARSSGWAQTTTRARTRLYVRSCGCAPHRLGSSGRERLEETCRGLAVLVCWRCQGSPEA